jgi:hypothetical protein
VRGKLVFLVILAMLVGLVFLVATRPRDPHVMPPARPDVVVDAATPEASSPDAPAPGAPAPSASASAMGPVAPAPTVALPDARAPMLDRPLRLVAASWEQAAAVLVANGGPSTADDSAMRAAGLTLTVEVAPAESDIESRLARGGADAEGADLAVLSLPSFVASYERLRALDPEIVHVVGWSRGREVLLGARAGMLARPGALPGDVEVASSDASASAFALFALDETGTPAARVRIGPDPRNPLFAALARPLPGDRAASAPSQVELTTADASRLVPLVAVSARGFIDGHAELLTALLKAWVEGSAALRQDVPGAARTLAGQPGAPDPASFLERLAWISDPGPADEALALGTQGRELLTVAWLFAHDWRLLRDTGAITSPAPSGSIVEAGPFARAFSIPPPRAVGAPFSAPDPSARTLLAHRVSQGDAAAIGLEAATLASLFERSVVRVSARTPSLARDAVDAAYAGHDFASGHIVAAAAALADPGVARVDVLAAP